ncbi:HET-domain-containing protein [Acephala macrosclerotiorum]|nr:HET-domain-containing protein [Acephala macrosclerotiorum]
MSLPQNTRLLVCPKCWEFFFSTPKFQTLCRTPDEGDCVQYTASTIEVEDSAASGCSWCRLVLSLKDDAEEQTLGEGHSPLQKIPVRFGAGPKRENFTPQGNNRFSLWINGASYFLTAFTARDDPTSGVVTAREMEHQINSLMAFDQAKKWLKECSSHKKCGIVGPTQLPSRVIEVSPENNPGTPRLLESSTIVDYFVALSYCWGLNQTGLTTKSNIKARQERLNIDSLSRTIQDAILVTRKINVKYLWADAICIIQDSQKDKNVELAKMCKIYQGALVTIVAANAVNANQGFLGDRPPPEPARKIPFWGPDGRLGTASIRLEGWYDDGNEPINERAWTFQERLLSPRLLIYASHTLQYQCNQDTINLGDSINLPSGLSAWRIPPASARLNVQAAGRTWGHIISMYSARRLSYLEDKLTALAGMAEAFQQQASVDYLAGLWSGDMLPRLLLWQTSRTDEYTPCPIYTAPSWSWASLSSPVYFSVLYNHHSYNWYNIDGPVRKIILESQTLPFGRVTGGYLKLSAHIRHGIYHPPQYIKWKTPLKSSMLQEDLESAASTYVDDDLLSKRNVICMAIAKRSYDQDATENVPVTFGSAARSIFETPNIEDSASWAVIDGLIITATGVEGTYRRVGCFFGAKENEFKDYPREEVTLAMYDSDEFRLDNTGCLLVMFAFTERFIKNNAINDAAFVDIVINATTYYAHKMPTSLNQTLNPHRIFSQSSA